MAQTIIRFDNNSYTIYSLGNTLLHILETVSEHGGVVSCQGSEALEALPIDILEKAMGWTRPYSSKIDNISESALLKDGSILMCWTVSTWEGTFASHDSIEVEYYLLRKV